MTAIHPVNATVERVERKEPPEPEGIIALYNMIGTKDGWLTSGVFPDESEYQAWRRNCNMDRHPERVVYIGPAAPSPASAEIDQLLVDLRAKIKAINALELKREDDALRALEALSEKLGRVTR